MNSWVGGGEGWRGVCVCVFHSPSYTVFKTFTVEIVSLC